MDIDFRVLPSGHLRCDGTEGAVCEAFSRSTGEGLIVLAARKTVASLPPPALFLRRFARAYLGTRCHLGQQDPSQPEALDPPDDETVEGLRSGLPPMQGGEYVSAEVLRDWWRTLDGWVCEQVRVHGGLAGFLRKRAPEWHQLGRVCLHLAENPSDPGCPFAFMATYTRELSSAGKVRHIPLVKALDEYGGARNKRALLNLLVPVQRAAESSELMRALVAEGDLYHPLAWTAPEAHAFLKEVPLYEECGLSVRVPDWWRKRSRPQVGITIGDETQTRLGSDALLSFRLELVLGDELLSEAELEEWLREGDGLRLFKGKWVEVDRARLVEVLDHWKKVEAEVGAGGISFAEGMRLLAGASADLRGALPAEEEGEWSFVRCGAWLGGLLDSLRAPASLRSARPGKALRATLRPYQEAGLAWLWFLHKLGLGACLADDMGLGKTIQVIALLLVIKKARASQPPSLLVLPASLLANWKAEIERFAPSLRCAFVHLSQSSKKDLEALAHSDQRALNELDAVLTTYGMLNGQPWLLERSWQLVVLDEAQAIKNPGTRQSRLVKKLHARSRIALTGTPVENRIGDLWSMFDFLCPGLLGTSARFKGFLKKLVAHESGYAPLRRLVSPYILRRLKTDKRIIADLPEKTEMAVYCGLSKRQAVLYQKTVEDLQASLQNRAGMQRKGLVLATLLRLKQICNHPSQLLGDGLYEPRRSGKFERLAAISQEIAGRQEKLLLFTQFRELVEPLAAFLASVFGRAGLVLHGGTRVKQRRQRVEQFQREDGPPFFILSLKAGGTGLNLTAASHVVHFDRWWNPAVENQATDRAFRIGQKNNVLVHKFVCLGTVEEKIDALIREKTTLAEEVLGTGADTLLTEMENEELIALVSLDVQRTRV